MKNIWKYTAFLGFFTMTITILVVMFLFVCNIDIKTPKFYEELLVYSLSLFVSSFVFGAILNFKLVIKEVKELF